MPENKDCLIIAHGVKTNQEFLKPWIDLLTLNNFKIQISLTKAKGDAEVFAKETKANLILVFGGDGTISEVINGIYKNAQNPILAFVPKGTGNDFAKSTDAFRNLSQFQSALNSFKIDKIDLLLIQGEDQERIIGNIADVGLGGAVVEYVEDLRFKKTRFPYFKAIIKGFRNYKPMPIELEFNEEKLTLSPLLVAFANGSYFGNGLGIAPQADVQNGKIAITTINNVSVMTYLKFMPKLKKKKFVPDDRIQYYTTEEVRISPTNLLYEIDGEPYQFKNGATIKVLTKALRILKSSV